MAHVEVTLMESEPARAEAFLDETRRELVRVRTALVATVDDLRADDPSGSVAVHGIAEVDAALERIDAGTFGRCTGCDREIPAERLAAMPTAELCVSCQTDRETRPS